jgi:hypothetical protein
VLALGEQCLRAASTRRGRTLTRRARVLFSRQAIVDKNARIGNKCQIINKDGIKEANREDQVRDRLDAC